jgi:hypothetical protein
LKVIAKVSSRRDVVVVVVVGSDASNKTNGDEQGRQADDKKSANDMLDEDFAPFRITNRRLALVKIDRERTGEDSMRYENVCTTSSGEMRV